MMMVNQINNEPVPWPSTIPDQMPWFNPSTYPPGAPMQFIGQQACQPVQSVLAPTTCQLQPQPSHLLDTQVITSISQQTPAATSSMIQNPFYPQHSSGILLTPDSQGVNQPLDITQPSYGANTSLHPVYSQHQASMASFGSSLTHMPDNSIADFEPVYQTSSVKRSSFEMEDDLTTQEAPPTKQQLSESKLFQRFGSLHLDNESENCNSSTVIAEVDSDDSDDDKPSTSTATGSDARKEFDRYVYLLFKGKKSDGHFPVATSNAVERLIREEREKLSKAVILWNPPPKNRFIEEVNESDDDEVFEYKDHRDFLKEPESSIMITEVTDDEIPGSLDDSGTQLDDVMQE